jgi:hypothetical protein
MTASPCGLSTMSLEPSSTKQMTSNVAPEKAKSIRDRLAAGMTKGYHVARRKAEYRNYSLFAFGSFRDILLTASQLTKAWRNLVQEFVLAKSRCFVYKGEISSWGK